MIRNKQFAVGTWEAHLADEQLRAFLYNNDLFSYIDTAIDYNNDYLLAGTTKPLISKISSYHLSEYEFFVSNHLRCLQRDSIDIMLIHSSRGNWQDLARRLKSDSRFKELGVSNFNIAEIEQFKEIVGYYPKYNEIEVNPLYTDIETVEFCQDHNIKIIAYAVVGGKYLARKLIAEYSLPYLLSYAAQHADILILKPESTRHFLEYADCVLNAETVEPLQYYPSVDDSGSDATNKQIVPMRYTPPKNNTRHFCGKPTYHTCCGKNYCADIKLQTLKLLLVDMPEFEMLGDYQTYLRYRFRQKYDGSPVYDYDFLIGDDGAYYVVYLITKDGLLTKVKQDNAVEVYKYEKV